MAADTLLREPLPPLAGMAPHAIGAAMLPSQRETGFGMVIRQDSFPAGHRMATLTVSTQPTEMRIFLGVTADASCRGRPVIGSFGMATRACCLQMPANQRIVSQTMVEFCWCKRDQSMSAPMMLAMTSLALLRPGVGFSMKPPGPANVAGNPLMTSKAFAVLGLTLERGMAAIALLLYFRVRGTQRSRADQLFPRALRTGVRCQQQQGDKRKDQPPEMH